jgi:glycerophosphoryl diester phosphodiesterase
MNSLLSKIAQGRTLNIAHRGARSLAPENTLSAALKAAQAGADLWELDVVMTADGEPIVLHDKTLNRTSNAANVFPLRRPWWVHEFSFEEIRALDFGSWFKENDPFGQFAAGMLSDEDLESYSGEPAPTLGEALQFTLDHKWYVNIEIKDLRGTTGHHEIVKKVVESIEKSEMSDRVLISSFNHSYVEQVKAMNPALPTGVLVDRPHWNPLGLLENLKADAYHPRISTFRAADVRLLHERGKGVLVWVANDEADMRSLIQKGVNGIFTDFPQLLGSILKIERDSIKR